jgi:hypothetical protein
MAEERQPPPLFEDDDGNDNDDDLFKTPMDVSLLCNHLLNGETSSSRLACIVITLSPAPYVALWCFVSLMFGIQPLHLCVIIADYHSEYENNTS